MAVADRSIDPRILESARTEFLASGFEKASLKTICEGAGVTTGALYKRYKGKEELFCAVVEQTVSDLYEVAHARGDKDPTAMSNQELIKAWDMDGADMMWWFRFLYDRRDDFYLLLSCSQGTRYANFPHDWAELLTKATSAYLAEAQLERCDSVKRSNETINGYIESSINLDSSALITKVIETEPFKQQKRFGLEINEPDRKSVV